MSSRAIFCPLPDKAGCRKVRIPRRLVRWSLCGSARLVARCMKLPSATMKRRRSAPGILGGSEWR